MAYINGKEVLFSAAISVVENKAEEYHEEMIRNAIIGRGGAVAADASFQDFPSAIYNIPADNAITTITDNSIARVKTVPTNSTKYAYLAEFGGMTYRDEETDTLVNAKVTEIVSKGKNLFDISKCLNDNLKDNGDGTYTITYNGSGSGRFSATAPIYIPANTPFVLKGIPISGVTNAPIQFIIADGTQGKTAYASGSTYNRTFEQDVTGVRIYIGEENTVGSSITFRDVQIELGTVATEYTPYHAPISYPIPAEIQALEGYGKGVNIDYYNKVNLENRKYFKTCVTVVFTGSNTEIIAVAQNQDGTYHYAFHLDGKTKPKALAISSAINCVSNHYEAIPRQDMHKNNGISAYGDYIRVRDVEFETAQDIEGFRAKIQALYESGNPLTVTYIMETPEEVDLPVYMSPLIEVEGSGSIVFVNEHDYAVPSKMIYQTLTQ